MNNTKQSNIKHCNTTTSNFLTLRELFLVASEIPIIFATYFYRREFTRLYFATSWRKLTMVDDGLQWLTDFRASLSDATLWKKLTTIDDSLLVITCGEVQQKEC